MKAEMEKVEVEAKISIIVIIDFSLPNSTS
jgi:hypothetical protein